MARNRDLSKLLSTTNGKITGSNLDVSFENISDTGTEGTKVASGTTAQRGSTAGQWRYNSTTNFFEGRNASGTFQSLEPGPTVTSVDDGEVDSAGGGNQTIVITGTNFTSGSVASFVGSSATFNASTTTVDNSLQITAVAPKSSFLNAQEPYKVKITSSSGLSGTSAVGLINVDNAPTWTTNAGSLGSITEQATGNHFTVVASDPESDTVSYSLQSGSLGGLSLNSSTGVISGDPTDVVSDTTNNFTIRATAGSKTSDRDFSYITTNINTFEIMVLGGGGSGGYTTQGWVGGGGGSGGISYRSAIALAGSTNFTVTIGNGGATATSQGSGGGNVAESGANSQFSGTGLTLVAYGGGGGAGYNGAYTIGASGGSGGGAEGGTHNQSTGASATQGTGGTTHYGNRGGIGDPGGGSPQSDSYRGGGGGGTGEAGDTDGIGHGGDGTSAFNTWLAATSTGVESGGTRYIGAGGSAGRAYGSQTPGGLGGGGQGGNNSGSSGTAGQANTGSGGGGRGMYNQGSGTGGAGGSGLVIVRYQGTQIGGSSGGTIVTTGGYTYHTFTSNGTFRTST